MPTQVIRTKNAPSPWNPISTLAGGFAEGVMSVEQLWLQQRQQDRQDAAFVWQQEQARITNSLAEQRMELARKDYGLNKARFDREEEDRQKRLLQEDLYTDFMHDAMLTTGEGKTPMEIQNSWMSKMMTLYSNSDKYKELKPDSVFATLKLFNDIFSGARAKIHSVKEVPIPGTDKMKLVGIDNQGMAVDIPGIPESQNKDIISFLNDAPAQWNRIMSSSGAHLKDILRLKNMSRGAQMILGDIVQAQDPVAYMQDALRAAPQYEKEIMAAIKQATQYEDYFDYVRKGLSKWNLDEPTMERLLSGAFGPEYVNRKLLTELEADYYNKFFDDFTSPFMNKKGEMETRDPTEDELLSLQNAIEDELGGDPPRDSRHYIAAMAALGEIRDYYTTRDEGIRQAYEDLYTRESEGLNLAQEDPITKTRSKFQVDPWEPVAPTDNAYQLAMERDNPAHPDSRRLQESDIVSAAKQGDPWVQGWPGVTGPLRLSQVEEIFIRLQTMELNPRNNSHVEKVFKMLVEEGRLQQKRRVDEQTGKQFGQLISASKKFEEMMGGTEQ